MPDRIQKLQDRIDEIEALKSTSEWGAEYQLWKDRTERFVQKEYGDEAFNLFRRQNSVVLDDAAYLRELEGRKKILEGFIKHHKEYKPRVQEQVKRTPSESSSPFTVHGDFIAGDKVGNDKNVASSQNIFSSAKDIPLWLRLVSAIVAILTFGWGIYIYFNPSAPGLWPAADLTSETHGFATTTPNLSSIFLKTNSMSDLEKESFLKDFENGPVYATGAAFENINSSGDGFIVRMVVERNVVGCAFSSDFKKDLLLLKKGDKLSFYGIFTGSGLGGYGAVNPWYITDCTLLK